MPGVLKNALDWLVGSGEFSGRRVTLFNASSRGVFAQASLREVLVTMDATFVAEAELTVPALGTELSPEELALNDDLQRRILAAIHILTAT